MDNLSNLEHCLARKLCCTGLCPGINTLGNKMGQKTTQKISSLGFRLDRFQPITKYIIISGDQRY